MNAQTKVILGVALVAAGVGAVVYFTRSKPATPTAAPPPPQPAGIHTPLGDISAQGALDFGTHALEFGSNALHSLFN